MMAFFYYYYYYYLSLYNIIYIYRKYLEETKDAWCKYICKNRICMFKLTKQIIYKRNN